nr:hypothetical protein Itr_chr14CG11400 [Ipomoea trifida]
MVSELAGEGAMPPQLPTLASQRRLEIAHLPARLRQPIRKGSLLHRGVTMLKVLTIFCFLIRLEQFFNHQGCYQKKRSESMSF